MGCTFPLLALPVRPLEFTQKGRVCNRPFASEMNNDLRLGCRRGRLDLFAVLAGALDAGGLAFQIAEVVQTGAADVALARDFD